MLVMFVVVYIFIVSSTLKECSNLEFQNQGEEEIADEDASKDCKDGEDDDDELSSEDSGSESENEDDDDRQARERLAELNTDEEKKAERLQPAIQEQLVSYCRGELFRKMKFTQDGFMKWNGPVSRRILEGVVSLKDLELATVRRMWRAWIKKFVVALINERRSGAGQTISVNLRYGM